jgi:hypothetical protein
VYKALQLVCLILFSTQIYTLAERIGDFDIFTQKVDDQEGKNVRLDSGKIVREVKQNLNYRIRVDYKGLKWQKIFGFTTQLPIAR